ncbi:MAG: hypothetical protein HY040_03110 [Planctomycetes bacterium]|nr:hypothetical protein [Planctomycetota bacterium]
MTHPDLFRRAQEYANRRGLVLGPQLGFGVHGIVFSAKDQSEEGRSAIKAHEREAHYLREREVYLRLKENDVTEVCGCKIPRLVSVDDTLWILEITVVSRPFVLDFAGAQLDRPYDFSAEVMADWQQAKQEQFGANWPKVQAILRNLESNVARRVEDLLKANLGRTLARSRQHEQQRKASNERRYSEYGVNANSQKAVMVLSENRRQRMIDGWIIVGRIQRVTLRDGQALDVSVIVCG